MHADNDPAKPLLRGPPPRRILHVLGTAELHARSYLDIIIGLAAELDPRRYEVSACFLSGDGPSIGELRKHGIAAFPAGWDGSRRDIAGFMRFERFLRRSRFDALHQHAGGGMVRLAAALAGKPVIAHVHGRESEEERAQPVYRTVRGAAAVVATSDSVAKVVTNRRAFVVYPALPLGNAPSHTPRHSTNTTVIGTARRLVPAKGVHHLLQAFALLRRRHENIRLEIAGDGPALPGLRRQAQELGVANDVCFRGWDADVFSTMHEWNVFVMPSVEEGFGVAALEAMAVGLPIVASNVGGIPELVLDEVTGLLVPPAHPPALAAALQRLIIDPHLAETLGAAGQRRALYRFTAARMARDMAQVYDSAFAVR